MRVTRAGAGLALASALLLAGCAQGGDDPADETSAADEQSGGAEESAEDEPDDDAASDCPELAVGEAVDVAVLAQCAADATAQVAGYAAETDLGGSASQVRVNTDPQALHMTSAMGEVVVVDGVTYVRTTGEWQEGDPESSDPLIAGLSAAGENIDSLDPAAQAAAMTGVELTVTGTDTRLDQEVFVISGEGEVEGAAVSTVMYVTADYAVLGNESSADVSGTTIDTVITVTAWDEAQDISAPM
ncbi:hypothetical protein Bcav_3654 [Beutenbergia cavernae DSM 12333]|uniref:Lipoprotein n=1 Tax=Beutenbergia cavernae (strain ATCC BAA-8 / DSM 12333 / CCUG 43141 / JCM 11478 / NBRC 16432 / NCIMB 13614 / HKI 0122) TaxID=471853 RepID=C5C3I7_BEUC1|nr:hypothetical protein [Beutenbergia cavernae]ACQ81896.1 hypothetical protein Bcav_3654 [Beutenbergia cavernae DSM 12333]